MNNEFNFLHNSPNMYITLQHFLYSIRDNTQFTGFEAPPPDRTRTLLLKSINPESKQSLFPPGIRRGITKLVIQGPTYIQLPLPAIQAKPPYAPSLVGR